MVYTHTQTQRERDKKKMDGTGVMGRVLKAYVEHFEHNL